MISTVIGSAARPWRNDATSSTGQIASEIASGTDSRRGLPSRSSSANRQAAAPALHSQAMALKENVWPNGSTCTSDGTAIR